MGKKDKRTFDFEEEFEGLVKLAPKIKALLSMNREIAEGYRKHRKKGGEAIPALEKHLGVKKQVKSVPASEPVPEELPIEVAPPRKSTTKKNVKEQSGKALSKAAKNIGAETGLGKPEMVETDAPQT